MSLQCPHCGGYVLPINVYGLSAPAEYVCTDRQCGKRSPFNDLRGKNPVQCPKCKKKIAQHIEGTLIADCPRCKERFQYP